MKSKFIIGNDEEVTQQLDELLSANDIVHMHFNTLGEYDNDGYFCMQYHVLVIYKERKENRLRLRKRRTVPEFEENGPDEKPYFSVDQKVVISSKENQGCLGKIGAAIVCDDDGVKYSVDVLFDRYGNQILGTSMFIDEQYLHQVSIDGEIGFGLFKGALVKLILPESVYNDALCRVESWEVLKTDVLVHVTVVALQSRVQIEVPFSAHRSVFFINN